MRRSLILPALVLVLAVGAIYLGGLRGEPVAPRPPSPRHRPSASPPLPRHSTTPVAPPAAAPGAVTLTYLRGTRIVTRARGQGGERTIFDPQTADVTAAQASGWIAYVAQSGGATTDGDFVRKPKLHLMNLASGEDLNVGVGFSPLWDATGDRIAYLAPDSPRSCDGETCAGAVRVMVAGPADPTRAITGFGHLHLVAWAGDRLLVADDNDLSHTTSLAVDGSAPLAIPVPPAQIWDASPDGRMLISVTTGEVHLTTLAAGRPKGSVRTIPSAAILGDGSWSAGSGRVAVVLRQPGGGTSMALMGPNGGPIRIPGSKGAMGNVVWDRAGTRFAYIGVDQTHRGRLQAVLCRVELGRRAICKPWFHWIEGVSLLRLSAP